jgi:RNA polymerase sigma-70 factor (sigma-E family)
VSEPPDFQAFVSARWPALVRYAYVLTGDRGHAEDLVQHALERCWQRWRQVRAEGAEAYVRTAIARLAISRWRRIRVFETAAATEPAEAGHEDGVVLQDALWRALAELPPRMRAVLVLKYIEDLPDAETARLLGSSIGTVKSQASRGLERLRSRSALVETDAPAALAARPAGANEAGGKR